MRDQAKTKEQMVAELRSLRARLAEAQAQAPPPGPEPAPAAASPVFRQVFAQAALGMALVSPQGRFLRVNRHLCEMLGYSEHEFSALDLTQLVHPEDLEATQRHLANLPRGPRVVQQERRFLHRYGHALWVLVKSTLVHGQDGRLEYLISLYMDITQQKVAEAALSESEEKYRTIFETAGSAMVIMEEDTTILLANTEFARLTGTRKEDLNGKASWTQFIAPHDVQRMLGYHRLRRVDPGAAPRAYEAQVFDGQARLRDCLVTVAVVPGTRRSVASLLDLTERKQLEAQLRQAQKMEAIGTLAGGVAHDFNNILASILGFTEIALHDFLEPGHPACGPLEEVIRAAKRARDLADQILTFSRRGSEERLPLSLASVVKEALKLLRASLPAFIEISAPIDGQAGMVLADPTQMHQVVINLCANAAQAMGQAGGRLMVGLKLQDLDQQDADGLDGLAPGPHVCLSVGDSGQGMAPEVLERIFEPYFTTKGPGEGTGLGLAVVHGIVKGHRGAIQVKSTPGQ
ncbi:MAG: PAS domain S-box protein, partial [Desulfarculus sp.]|nr:PAS domain S-box protein [Desulfarculus sp.]